MRKYLTIRSTQVHLGFIAMLCIILLLSSVLAVIYYTKTIDYQASIIANGKIQAYLDGACTQVLNSYNWGSFNTSSGDDVKFLDVYLRNEGNVGINVTWVTSDFTSYDGTNVQYETSSWKLYLVKVDGSEVKLRPENDTTPSKVYLSPEGVAHLKFYLAAKQDSPPQDFIFHTSFNSRSD